MLFLEAECRIVKIWNASQPVGFECLSSSSAGFRSNSPGRTDLAMANRYHQAESALAPCPFGTHVAVNSAPPSSTQQAIPAVFSNFSRRCNARSRCGTRVDRAPRLSPGRPTRARFPITCALGRHHNFWRIEPSRLVRVSEPDDRPPDDADLVVKMLEFRRPRRMLDLEDSTANAGTQSQGIKNIWKALTGRLTYLTASATKQWASISSATVISRGPRPAHSSGWRLPGELLPASL